MIDEISELKEVNPVWRLALKGVFHPRQTSALFNNESELISYTWRLIGLACLLVVIASLLREGLRLEGFVPDDIDASARSHKVLSSPLGRILLVSIIVTVLLVCAYPVSRWFWLRLFGYNKENIGILTGLMLGHSFTCVVMIPEVILVTIAGSISSFVGQLVSWLFMFVSFLITSYYMQLRTSLGFGKAFLLNLAITVLIILGFIVVAIAIGIVVVIYKTVGNVR